MASEGYGKASCLQVSPEYEQLQWLLQQLGGALNWELIILKEESEAFCTVS